MKKLPVFASQISRRMTTTVGYSLDPVITTILIDQVLPIFIGWLRNICNVAPENTSDHVRSLNAKRPKFLRSQMDKALVKEQIERHRNWCNEYGVTFRRKEALMSKSQRAEIIESTIEQVLETPQEELYEIILELE
jgi:hypothetical protein